MVAGLAGAQCSAGIDAHVFSGDGGDLATHMQYWRDNAAELSAASVHTVFESGIGGRTVAVRAWLLANVTQYDVVHIHSLWRAVPTLAAMACRQLNVPYLIAPHTALSPWALAQKSLKKRLARMLVWNRLLGAAAGFHALNELEADEIRNLCGGASSRIFVVPNGVSLAEFSANSAIDLAVLSGANSSLLNGRPFVLFLARLHKMKGPDLLLEAFARIANQEPELNLVFAGPDFGMLAALQERVAQLGLANRIFFPGLTSGNFKLWLLKSAVCLCQPSRSEGFSLSILEALASACPVVISDCCKFPAVMELGAGIVVPLAVENIAAGLQIYTHDLTRRAADGLAARQLIERSYTWEIVSKQAEKMYAQAVTPAAAIATSVDQHR